MIFSRCDPVRCSVKDYYGQSRTVTSHGKRRKRRRSLSDKESGETVRVAGAITITDRFEGSEKEEEEEEEQETKRMAMPAGGQNR